MSTNYSEQIFQSIDTIISQRLNEVSFDKTEICEVISQDKNDKRKYLVSNGSLKYEAYSDDENRSYLNNQNQKVYVRITNGDYSLRKIITGSYAADETNENLYVNPFNYLVTSSTLSLSNSIWAKVNDEEYDEWDDTPSNETKPNSVEFLTNFKYKNIQDFDYIGLDFSFNTNIVGYQGSYTLRISLWNGETDLTKDDNTLILSSKNLYGNPYNLNSSLSFQHLFPWPTRKKDNKIEPIPINEITKIKLQLIQDNKFLKQQDEINVNTDTWIELTKADLKFGYDIKNITKDELQLVLEEGQSLKYTTGESATARTLYLNWNHFDTFNNPYIFNINQLPNIFEEYTVYWLHYVDGLGENVDLPDKYAWNWETINFIEGLETDQDLTKLINLTTQFRTDQYKVVIKYTTNKFTEEQKNNITNFNNLKSEYKQLLLDLKNPNLTKEDKTNKKTRLEEIQESKELVNFYYTYTESTGLVFDNTDVAADPGTSNSSEDSLRIKLDEGDTGIYNIYGLDGRMMDSSYRGPHNIHFEFLDTTPLDRITSINWEFPTFNTMIKDVADTDKQQATFNIDTMYKPGAMNNRIWCTVILTTGEIRRGSLTLQFGEATAAGSNYAFNIDFVGNRTCLYATGENDSIEIQATFTRQNGEIMTVPTIKWSWMNNYDSPIILSGSTGEKITLTYNNNEVLKENYSILQATIEDYSIDNGLATNLTTYLPIPIAKSEYNYISGATRVVYDSNGNSATYSKNPYELYNLTNKIENTSWAIISNSISNTFQLKTQSIRDENGNTIREEKTLLPLSYIPQEPPATCVYCMLNEDILWSQPILIMQNRWEYDLLNEWNGQLKSDGENYVLAPLLGAGKKEGDNGFTGVLMGDLRTAEGQLSETGLYGFKEGSRRFSFNDKGEAYIGTNDNYIKFDNTNLTINVQNFHFALGEEQPDYVEVNFDEEYYFLNWENYYIKDNNGNYIPNTEEEQDYNIIYYKKGQKFPTANGIYCMRDGKNIFSISEEGEINFGPKNSGFYYNEAIGTVFNGQITKYFDDFATEEEKADRCWFDNFHLEKLNNYFDGLTGCGLKIYSHAFYNDLHPVAETDFFIGGGSYYEEDEYTNMWYTAAGIIYSNANMYIYTEDTGYLYGTWWLNSDNVIQSDQNTKHDVENLSSSYEILFDNLTPVRYKYNNGTSNRYHLGLIAQDVEKAIEISNLTLQDCAILVKDKKENYGLRYGEFISLNIWQIQKLKNRVTELENEIKEIKQRYEI